MFIFRLCRRLLDDTEGATAIEYGLITALIAVSLIVGAQAVGSSVNNLFTGISGKLSSAMN